jgi:hydroxyethylthiazole kinase-like uncharacterized protein yjeF
MYTTTANAPVYRTAELRRIETIAMAAQPSPGLMERAGLAAAEIARTLATGGGRILVIAGPGNNGGDAFVAARWLRAWHFSVDLVFAGDTAKLPADAGAAFSAWQAGGGANLAAMPAGREWDLVIDGLFGIGLQRDISGHHAELIAAINCLGACVLALDLPSGLASDSGRIMGSAINADYTATFIALKPGLLTNDGPDCCGQIHVCPLGLDVTTIAPATGAVIGSDIFRAVLPPRRANSHKGSFGSVGIVGGAPGMAGAALLAGRAALNLGAGRVYVGMLDAAAPRLDPLQPELMLRDLGGLWQLPDLACLAVGPGLGTTPEAHDCVRTAMASAAALVLDADALNLIAADSALQEQLRSRTGASVLTPHPAEAARLMACTIAEIQADRVAAACEIAKRYRSPVVVKGAGSVCASADGRWFINTSGNPGMATAGMGDVLTGMIAALLAQGAQAKDALLAAVHLHGAAADALVKAGTGPVGLTASEVSVAARDLYNRR